LTRVCVPLFAPAQSQRPRPDAGLEEAELSAEEKRHAIGLMRVNHCGEVCAQALYQGQALTARNPAAREALQHAAFEEWNIWPGPSSAFANWVVSPVCWALVVYRLAGHWRDCRFAGDKWNLGFLEETEHQVGAHLDSHLTACRRQMPRAVPLSARCGMTNCVTPTWHTNMALPVCRRR
jgi:ubiquinone biosynthesis monooxygenase Coq7